METEGSLQHRLLQKEYGGFYRAVSDILFQHNFKDLDGKHNTGDHDAVVDLLLLRIQEAANLEALHAILFEVFLNAFGEENCGSKERCGGAAAEIWKAYERHRSR